ncbi:MAG: glycosyltransferase [Candidatus Omnitrophota bacterium]|nr:glycosyltransferase [Candidatus Omnitrophota bacterium]MDZ4243407.1 glycosyltransferase [Candidatus Omnitrophota bacterium]
MPQDLRPVVAHVNRGAFTPSQTFVYFFVSHLKFFRAVCLAEEIANLETFPFPRGDIYRIAPGRFPFWDFYRRWRYGPLGMDAAKAIQALRTTGAQCIHAHFGPNGYFSLALRRALKIPLVTSFYGYDVTKLSREEEWRTKYRELFCEGDCFLVEGPVMRFRLAELGCPPEKIRIQRIGVPVAKMAPPVRSKTRDKTVIVFCGRFVEKKGLKYALRALAEVKRTKDRFEFRVIGDGPEKQKVSELIGRLGLNGHVKLLGFLNYDRYLDELGRADMLLQPSVTAADGDTEGGAPTVILEAQALGVPVISTTHADIPSVVVPGKSAVLSPERDVELLSRNILFLLKNPGVRQDMGLRGREFVGEHHDIRKEAPRLEAIYQSLIEARPRSWPEEGASLRGKITTAI